MPSPTPTPSTSSPSTTTHPPETNPVEAKKISDLESKIAGLERQIAETRAKQAELEGKLVNPDAQATVSAHIKLLHRYNEIRDVGHGLLGLIAEKRGVRVRDVMEEFGVGEGD